MHITLIELRITASAIKLSSSAMGYIQLPYKSNEKLQENRLTTSKKVHGIPHKNKLELSMIPIFITLTKLVNIKFCPFVDNLVILIIVDSRLLKPFKKVKQVQVTGSSCY